MTLRLLDAYCGQGGASKGYMQAGFHVTGCDLVAQPRYCGDAFIRGDALEYIARHGHEYDALAASPPCQAYTPLAALSPHKVYPDLVAATRALLEASGRPWVIENVPGAPLRHYVMLCGTMFGLRVYRHRRFETSFLVMQPEHPPHLVRANGHKGQRQRKAHYVAGGFVTITGDVGSYCGGAMGISWMTGAGLSQAIPPAYTRWVGDRLMAVLQRQEVPA